MRELGKRLAVIGHRGHIALFQPDDGDLVCRCRIAEQMINCGTFLDGKLAGSPDLLLQPRDREGDGDRVRILIRLGGQLRYTLAGGANGSKRKRDLRIVRGDLIAGKDIVRLLASCLKDLEGDERTEALLGGKRLRLDAGIAVGICGHKAVLCRIDVEHRCIGKRTAVFHEACVGRRINAEREETGDDRRVGVDVAVRAVGTELCRKAGKRGVNKLLCIRTDAVGIAPTLGEAGECRQRPTGSIRIGVSIQPVVVAEHAVLALIAQKDADQRLNLRLGILNPALHIGKQRPDCGGIVAADILGAERCRIVHSSRAVDRIELRCVNAEHAHNDLRLGAILRERVGLVQSVNGKVDIVLRSVVGDAGRAALTIGEEGICRHVEDDPFVGGELGCIDLRQRVHQSTA